MLFKLLNTFCSCHNSEIGDRLAVLAGHPVYASLGYHVLGLGETAWSMYLYVFKDSRRFVRGFLWLERDCLAKGYAMLHGVLVFNPTIKGLLVG